MMRNPILILCAVALAAASACSKEAAPVAPPPPEVLVTAPVQRDVPVYMELVGQAVGFQDVEIRARVEGFLETMTYTEGSLVSKGQLLYTIDPKPLQAVLANAKANLATSQARPRPAGRSLRPSSPRRSGRSRRPLASREASQRSPAPPSPSQPPRYLFAESRPR